METDVKNFTGDIRIVLKAPVQANVTLPVTVRVTGTMTLPLADYRNSVDVTYGKRVWNTPSMKYAATVETSERSQAAFTSALSPTPQVTATAVAMAAKLYDEGAAIAPTDAAKQPILARTGSGWRFQVNNNSVSKMEPASFTVGTTYGSDVAAGFTTERVGINQALLDNGVLNKIDVTYRVKEGALFTTKHAIYTLNPDASKGEKDLAQLLASRAAYTHGGQEIWKKNADGKFVDIKGNVIPNQEAADIETWTKNGVVLIPEDWTDPLAGEGYFSSMTLSFDEIKGKKDIGSRKMYVEIQGSAEDLAKMEMSGTLTTNYEQLAAAMSGRNVMAKATASFTSRKAPYVLGVTTTGMRESKVPGDPNAFVGNLEYERDNDGNIYYTDASGNKGIIKDGQFTYGKVDKVTKNEPFNAI